MVLAAGSALSLQGLHGDLPLPGTSFSSGSLLLWRPQSLDVSQGRAPKSCFLPPQGSLWGSKQQAGQHS